MSEPKKKVMKIKKLNLKESLPLLTLDNIEKVYGDNFVDMDDMDKYESKLYNDFLLKKEALQNEILEDDSEHDFLYPSLDDPNFNIKIAEKKEFNDNKYDGTITDIEEQANKLCNAEFELAPHQLFVRNFLSFQTPYNSLLLYHGLGTGKTCSAISIAEEMRDYLKQVGITQRIIVVASPNVQENFKLQLFDDRKLELINDIWNLRSCTNNKYLKEINPMNMKGFTKDKVIRQVKKIINMFYLFVGYTEFANMVTKKTVVDMETYTTTKERNDEMIRKIKKTFSNRLIIIDEVHNIRISDDNENKRVAQELFKVVSHSDNLRLLFLSATPMFNSYKEIIWLLNIMNLNDKRGSIELKDVFDKDGNFLISSDGEDIGEKLLRRKATGYISFVRGENPYTFPYRIFPSFFSPEKTFNTLPYPRVQLNGKPIIQPLEHVNVFVNNVSSYQEKAYNYVIEYSRNKSKKSKDGMPSFDNMEKFGYTVLQKPLMALNMVFPHEKLDVENPVIDPKLITGSDGLRNIMDYTETTNPPTRKNFVYKKSKYGNIFSPELIGNFSSKIKSITENIMHSDGIVLIFSQFIDGGLVPIALALEELGFIRYGSKASNLFKTAPRPPIDVNTYTTLTENTDGQGKIYPATYTMITGEDALSPDKINDLKTLTSPENKNGEIIKVVLISKTGAEGLDFKNLRQVHILEPWYNLNLIEQIIGRAVRTCSHKDLNFIKRNVEIFMYGSLLENSEEEPADLYVYRLAELKAVQIGRVSRLLKESAIDCLLNIDQTNFSEERMNKDVKQLLSNKQEILYPVGDKPNTVSCDYMKTCEFRCVPEKTFNPGEEKYDSYSEGFIFNNTDKIMQRIRDLFKDRFFYTKEHIIHEINIVKKYPLIQIDAALTQLIEDKNEFIYDKYDRAGHLINIEEYYMFQPLEMNNENSSLYEKYTPLTYKREQVTIENVNKANIMKIKMDESSKDVVNDDEISDKPSIIDSMYSDYALINSKNNKIPKGTNDWRLYSSAAIIQLETQEYNVETIKKAVLHQIIERINFSNTLEIINYLYFNNELTEFEQMIKEYYDSIVIESKNITSLLFNKDGKQVFMIKGENEWLEAETEDLNDIAGGLEKYITEIQDYNKFVGFVSLFKKETFVFKVKNMSDKKSKGARCDQSGKSDAWSLLNNILDDNIYNVANVKGTNKLFFCSLQELYMRIFDIEKKNNKKWFLTPGYALLNNIEKIHF
jgi:hypothetical protein